MRLSTFNNSSSSLSIITGLSPSNAIMSCAPNPYLTSPCGVSLSLDVLNLYVTGSKLLTKSKPWGTFVISVLSLKSEVTVQSTLI